MLVKVPPTPKDMGKEEKSREKEKSEKKKDKHKHKEQPPEEEVGHVTWLCISCDWCSKLLGSHWTEFGL